MDLTNVPFIQNLIEWFRNLGRNPRGFFGSVNEIFEKIIKFLMGDLYSRYNSSPTEYQKIEEFLLNPYLTQDKISEFLKRLQEDEIKNEVVYKHLDGRITTTQELAFEIKRVLIEGVETKEGDIISELVDNLALGYVSEADVLRTYAGLINNSMLRSGRNKMTLSGSCGGSTVNKSTIESILGIDSSFSNIYSTDKRIMSGIKNEDNHYPDYRCPHCGKKLSGESKNNESSWRKECDYCKKPISCKK